MCGFTEAFGQSDSFVTDTELCQDFSESLAIIPGREPNNVRQTAMLSLGDLSALV